MTASRTQLCCMEGEGRCTHNRWLQRCASICKHQAKLRMIINSSHAGNLGIRYCLLFKMCLGAFLGYWCRVVVPIVVLVDPDAPSPGPAGPLPMRGRRSQTRSRMCTRCVIGTHGGRQGAQEERTRKHSGSKGPVMQFLPSSLV